MKKRLLSTLLVLCMALTLLPVQAMAAEMYSDGTEPLPPIVEGAEPEASGEKEPSEEEAIGTEEPEVPVETDSEVMELAATPVSGTCGANLTWTLDADGTLTISGTGAMTRPCLKNGTA